MTYALAQSAPTNKRRVPVSWVALAVLVLAFVAFSLPPYLTGDVTTSRVPPPAGVPGYHPLLVTHVVCGSVAVLTVLLQLWPWLRRRHPRVHRWIGRTYVFLGALPAGLTALPLAATSPFGPVGRVSSTILASLWLGATVTGFVLIRRRRFAAHRRWMIRSAALGLSIILNRVVGIVVFILLSEELDAAFGGNEVWLLQTVAGITTWVSWTSVLLVTEWWLQRDRSRNPYAGTPSRTRGAPPETGSVIGRPAPAPSSEVTERAWPLPARPSES